MKTWPTLQAYLDDPDKTLYIFEESGYMPQTAWTTELVLTYRVYLRQATNTDDMVRAISEKIDYPHKVEDSGETITWPMNPYDYQKCKDKGFMIIDDGAPKLLIDTKKFVIPAADQNGAKVMYDTIRDSVGDVFVKAEIRQVADIDKGPQ